MRKTCSIAFRMDVGKPRYRDWDDLMGYCGYSAMPVGRFVLDVHGESRDTWPASDALCAALQVINHLQDCGSDYRQLNRVYIPLDVFERFGENVEALGKNKASPALLRCFGELCRTDNAACCARPSRSRCRSATDGSASKFR